jgi:AraC-like DNA-binding protein
MCIDVTGAPGKAGRFSLRQSLVKMRRTCKIFTNISRALYFSIYNTSLGSILGLIKFSVQLKVFRMPQNDVDRIVNRLKDNLLKWMPDGGDYTTPIAGVKVHRRDGIEVMNYLSPHPIVAVMVQGHKHSIVGSEKYTCGAKKCLIVGANIPIVSYITEASAERPCMAMVVNIDKYIIANLAMEVSLETDRVSNKTMVIFDADEDLLDAFLRLSKLFYKPSQVQFIAPMLLREIHYRLLIGPFGSHLKEISTLGPQNNRIVQAIALLKKNYKNDLRVEELARQVNMATSTFHRNFKEVTTLSPLQYQKRLRLYEAQRLIVSENMSMGDAAYSVGYESLPQFSREYKRLIGEPPYKNTRKSCI